MADPFIAEIRMFGFNFAPRGWATCNGQIISIAQNTALFSLLGTTYGGDGRVTFQLPNLGGRAPLHEGQGPGLTPRSLGEQGGVSNITLTSAEVPAHTHQLACNSANANKPLPVNNFVSASTPGAQTRNAPALTAGVTMAAQALSAAGSGQPHNNLQPYLAVNFCICMQGVFPSRN